MYLIKKNKIKNIQKKQSKQKMINKIKNYKSILKQNKKLNIQ